MEQDYLIHYGIPKRSGRYPWGSGKRPFQSGGGPIGSVKKFFSKESRASRINRRATKKLDKIEEDRSASQKTSDKYFDKAVRRSNRRFFSSQKSVDKALDQARSSQRNVNRLEQKGKKYYQKVQRKISKLGQEVDPKVQKMGEEYIRRSRENSKAIYNAMLVNSGAGISYKYKKR